MSLESTLTLQNGIKQPTIFSRAEIDARLATLRQTMADQALEAVLFTSIHNINYFGDFVYCSFGRPYGLVVSAETSVSLTANIDGGWPWRRGHGENLIYTDWQRDNFFRGVQQLIPDGVRIGVEFDHLTVENQHKLQAILPRSTLVDIAPDTMAQRMLKSAEEIELIRNGARIADLGGGACVEALQDGVPEYEVAQHATTTMVRAIADTYPTVELMDTWTWFQSGLNTDGAHNPVTSRRVQAGDILSLNCFPMISGYYTALERTLFFDHCDDASLALWELNCQVHRRGLELIRPGMRCGDIAAELNEIYAAKDLLQYRSFGYGHSFGSLSHYYGREAGLELREDIDTVLAPGMVVSMEPMIRIPEGQPGAGGYREHDILVLTDTGAENITGFPFGPDHNIVRP